MHMFLTLRLSANVIGNESKNLVHNFAFDR